MGVSVKKGVGVSLGLESAIWVKVSRTAAWAVSAMIVLMAVSGVGVVVAAAGPQALLTSRVKAKDSNRKVLFVFIIFSFKRMIPLTLNGFMVNYTE
jgi:uncharacterized membrane protein